MLKQRLILLFLLTPFLAFSTHLRGGQIRVVSTDGYSCSIEVRLLTNTASEIRAGEGVFDFGDGSTFITPNKENAVLTEQANLGLVIYTINHQYAGPGFYVLSYSEPNLTPGILNMTNSGETRFTIQSGINIDPLHSFESPDFPTNPIFTWPLHREYAFSTATIDDSTSIDFLYKYSLVTLPPGVNDYEIPGNLKVNADNGIITWDTKFHDQYAAGLFWIEVRVDKYSRSGYWYGYVIRAIQLVVEDSGSRIDLSSSVTDANNKVFVANGDERKIKLVLTDNKDVDNLYFDLYYNPKIKNNISIVSHDSIAGDQRFKVAILSLKTSPNIINDLPYTVTLRGHSDYGKDITFLYLTKSADLPELPQVINGLKDDADLKVYPNPFHSELYVDGPASGEATLIDTFGRVLMRSALTQGQPLNTTSLSAGFYILRVVNSDGRASMIKLVRQ